MERKGGPRDAGGIWKAFSEAQTAVSAVISTILMVAITVVLAATAFVLVADVGGNVTEPAPALGMVLDDVADEIQVTSSSPKANWDRIALVLKSNGGTSPILLGNGAVVNDPAGTGGLAISGRVDIVQASMPIVGGDFLSFCRNGLGDGPAEIQVVDNVVNQLMGTYSFEGFEACT